MGERLRVETLERLRMWAFLGVVVCGALILGLSNAVWSVNCTGSGVLSFISIYSNCATVSGLNSHIVFDSLGDGQVTALFGFAILVSCAAAVVSRNIAGLFMLWAALISLVPLVVTASAAIHYGTRWDISQSLIFLTVAAIAAPLLSAAFYWLDIKHEQATMNGDNAWA
jgi:hypothetical protein